MSFRLLRRRASRATAIAAAPAGVLMAFLALMPFAASATTTTWPQETNLVLSGSAITLKIGAGSKSDSLSVTPTTFTVVVASGDTFTIRYPGNPSGTLTNDGGLPSCNNDYTNNNVVFAGPETVTFTPNAALTCSAVFGGGGGGGGGSGGGGGGGGVSQPVHPVQTQTQYDPDPTVLGTFTAAAALAATPTIDVDKGLIPKPAPPACNGGTLIKGSTPAVYYCGNDGKRYVFPNEHVYYSWYDDFSMLVGVSDTVLASIPIGGNVTMRPGKRMVKIMTDPKVYAVARHGLLRWIPSEAVAHALYGADWNRKIDDVPDSFFFSYMIGTPIPDVQ